MHTHFADKAPIPEKAREISQFASICILYRELVLKQGIPEKTPAVVVLIFHRMPTLRRWRASSTARHLPISRLSVLIWSDYQYQTFMPTKKGLTYTMKCKKQLTARVKSMQTCLRHLPKKTLRYSMKTSNQKNDYTLSSILTFFMAGIPYSRQNLIHHLMTSTWFRNIPTFCISRKNEISSESNPTVILCFFVPITQN